MTSASEVTISTSGATTDSTAATDTSTSGGVIWTTVAVTTASHSPTPAVTTRGSAGGTPTVPLSGQDALLMGYPLLLRILGHPQMPWRASLGC